MTDHWGHLALLLVPLVFVAVFQLRRLFPVALMLVLLHHHVDTPPGSASPTPPPLCCTLAVSTESEPQQAPPLVLVMVWLAPKGPLRRVPGFVWGPPSIRGPPREGDLPTPASWTPASRAA